MICLKIYKKEKICVQNGFRYLYYSCGTYKVKFNLELFVCISIFEIKFK